MPRYYSANHNYFWWICTVATTIYIHIIQFFTIKVSAFIHIGSERDDLIECLWVAYSHLQNPNHPHQSLCKSIINSQCINTILVLYCELGLCLPSWSTAVFLVLVYFPDSSTRDLLRGPRPVEQAGSRYLPHHNINIDVWGKSFYKSTYCSGCTILHLVCPWRLWPCIRCLQYKHPAH